MAVVGILAFWLSGVSVGIALAVPGITTLFGIVAAVCLLVSYGCSWATEGG